MKLVPNKEPKTDCFAYSKEKKECKILSELVCSYKDKCSFYKNHTNKNN